MSINFYSLVEGQRQGEQDAWNSLQRQQQALTGAIRVEDELLKRTEQQQRQQAATYLSPLLSYWQRAADQGQSDYTWLIGQRDAIQNDPNFQRFSPEVQQQVWQQLSGTLATTAERLQQSGQREALQQLWDAFGITSSPSVARDTGALEAAGILGSNSSYRLSDDGGFLVSANGQQIPLAYAEAIARTNPAAISSAFANQGQNDLERARNDAVLEARGWTRNANGHLVPPALGTPAAALDQLLPMPTVGTPTVLGPQNPLPINGNAPPAGLPFDMSATDQNALMQLMQGRVDTLQEEASVVPSAFQRLLSGNFFAPVNTAPLDRLYQAQDMATSGNIPNMLAFVAQGLQSPEQATALMQTSRSQAQVYLNTLRRAHLQEQDPVRKQMYAQAIANLQQAEANTGLTGMIAR